MEGTLGSPKLNFGKSNFTIEGSKNIELYKCPYVLNTAGDVVFLDDANDCINHENMEGDTPYANCCDETNLSTATFNHINMNALDQENEQQKKAAPQSIQTGESFNVPLTSDENLIPMIKLIQAVRKAGAPLSLVDQIVKIVIEEMQEGRLDVACLTTHRTALKRISDMFPALPMPISVPITHERTLSEMKAGVERPSLSFPIFSFLGQLQDLLDDHVFSDIQNLVVDPNDRWAYYKRNSCPHLQEEIQDGNWFQNIIQNIDSHPCPVEENDFVFGIQGYIDKTGTDAYQRNSVEPFVFTLTILSNQLRNTSKYWRVLALLPSSVCQTQKKKQVFGASVRNYHIALRAALKEFGELQKNPPTVRLRLGDEFNMVRARLFWINAIADGLANEQLVGRIQNRISSPRLSRGCHCPQHIAENSHLQCKFLRQASIERLVMAALGPSAESIEWSNYLNSLPNNNVVHAAEATLEMRKKFATAILKNVFGQHVVDLVWFHIDQGPNPRGCFGSTAVDPMHAFEEGIVPNILSVILDPLS